MSLPDDKSRWPEVRRQVLRRGAIAELHRVLRKGGRLAAYDVVIGNGEPLHFPVPWSREPATSFLLTSDAMRAN